MSEEIIESLGLSPASCSARDLFNGFDVTWEEVEKTRPKVLQHDEFISTNHTMVFFAEKLNGTWAVIVRGCGSTYLCFRSGEVFDLDMEIPSMTVVEVECIVSDNGCSIVVIDSWYWNGAKTSVFATERIPALNHAEDLLKEDYGVKSQVYRNKRWFLTHFAEFDEGFVMVDMLSRHGKGVHKWVRPSFVTVDLEVKGGVVKTSDGKLIGHRNVDDGVYEVSLNGVFGKRRNKSANHSCVVDATLMAEHFSAEVVLNSVMKVQHTYVIGSSLEEWSRKVFGQSDLPAWVPFEMDGHSGTASEIYKKINEGVKSCVEDMVSSTEDKSPQVHVEEASVSQGKRTEVRVLEVEPVQRVKRTEKLDSHCCRPKFRSGRGRSARRGSHDRGGHVGIRGRGVARAGKKRTRRRRNRRRPSAAHVKDG